MPLHEWQNNDVDRQPVGARQLTARYHRHRRARAAKPRPWWWPTCLADWLIIALAALYGIIGWTADWWMPAFVPAPW